jgi:hypothetical protein
LSEKTAMNLPFTVSEFLGVFETYNRAVFPLQLVFYLLALYAIYLVVKPGPRSDRRIVVMLAFFWLWMGLVYHLKFFTAINPAAYVFGAAFAGQSALFLAYGWYRHRLRFHWRANYCGWTGTALVLYALIIYPWLGLQVGHVYPQAPTFGLPCPTTIFTFGLLLWSRDEVPLPLLIVPCLWSIIGFMAAATLGIYEDIGLLVAAVLTVALLCARWAARRRAERGAVFSEL